LSNQLSNKQNDSKAVSAIVFNASKEILLVKRRDVPIWTLPGGGVEKGEAPFEAGSREVLEESLCTVKLVRHIGTYLPVNKLTVETYLFEYELVAGTPQPTNESKKADFFSLDNLPSPLFHLHASFIQDALLFKKEVISRNLEEISYGNLIKYVFKHPLRFTRFLLSKAGCPLND
jgi:8-oxo-dGTP diphosphatase